MEYLIVVENVDGTLVQQYKSSVVPRIGEALHFPHRGGFRVLDVIYRISDDSYDNSNILYYIAIIINTGASIKEVDYTTPNAKHS